MCIFKKKDAEPVTCPVLKQTSANILEIVTSFLSYSWGPFSFKLSILTRCMELLGARNSIILQDSKSHCKNPELTLEINIILHVVKIISNGLATK